MVWGLGPYPQSGPFAPGISQTNKMHTSTKGSTKLSQKIGSQHLECRVKCKKHLLGQIQIHKTATEDSLQKQQRNTRECSMLPRAALLESAAQQGAIILFWPSKCWLQKRTQSALKAKRTCNVFHLHHLHTKSQGTSTALLGHKSRGGTAACRSTPCMLLGMAHFETSEILAHQYVVIQRRPHPTSPCDLCWSLHSALHLARALGDKARKGAQGIPLNS